MRLAVLSDIHGNLLALEAVLADLASVGPVDHVWVLGDHVAFGPQPAAVLMRLRELVEQYDKGVVEIIGGNTERYLVTGKRSEAPPAADEQALQQWLASRADFDAVLQWTLREQLDWEDYEWLAKSLGREVSVRVPGYGIVIGVHGIPGDDEGYAFKPDSPDEEALDALLDREGRLVLAGHTHQRMDRIAGRWRIVNPGSVGMSYTQAGRAEWALLTFEGGEVQVELRGVPYGVQAVLDEAAAVGYPAPEFLADRLNHQDQ